MPMAVIFVWLGFTAKFINVWFCIINPSCGLNKLILSPREENAIVAALELKGGRIDSMCLGDGQWTRLVEFDKEEEEREKKKKK